MADIKHAFELEVPGKGRIRVRGPQRWVEEKLPWAEKLMREFNAEK